VSYTARGIFQRFLSYKIGERLLRRSGDAPRSYGGYVGQPNYSGFVAPTQHSEPTTLVFQVPRAGLTVKVHERVNVRILELIETASGSQIELEGNRLPRT
jgi:hypothetical protein